MAVSEVTAAPPPEGSAYGGVGARELMLGAIMLDLVSRWDSWVARRVDRFHLAGDDERVLQRHQSIDFKLPEHIAHHSKELVNGDFPVPIAFMSKWRLPEFSLRDGANRSVPLLQREASVPIAAGMLIALGTLVKSSDETLLPKALDEHCMPRELRAELIDIVSAEPVDALRRCANLSSDELAGSSLFMSLAYELAVGFLVIALPREPGVRDVLKLAHTSYIVPAQRDRWTVRLSHLRRWSTSQRRDAIDPVSWQDTTARTHSAPLRKREATGELVLSTLHEKGSPEGLNQGPLTVACALAKLQGPHGERTIRLRPTGVVAMRGMPPGQYALRVEAQGGFRVTPSKSEFAIEPDGVARVHLRSHGSEISRRAMLAPPRLAAPASPWKVFQRGCGWASRPLAIRVRLGSAASYHCQFEAPPGLHVTRGRLIANLEDEPPCDGGEGHTPVRDIDVVLDSTQRAHLYAPAHRARPATGYAYFNMRPRVETIVRPALGTAIAATIVLVVVASMVEKGLLDDPKNAPWTLMGLLLGGPSALAAYFAQAVHSRVTNAMLYGLRIIALLPAVLSLAAAAAILVIDGESHTMLALYLILGSSVLLAFSLGVTYRYAEHPREQKPPDSHQRDALVASSHV